MASPPPAATSAQMDAFLRRLKIILTLAVAAALVPLLVYSFAFEPRPSRPQRYSPPAEADTDRLADVAIPARRGRPERGETSATIYVPVYSHVYHQDGDALSLTVTLSVRNVSDESPIVIRSVRYSIPPGRSCGRS